MRLCSAEGIQTHIRQVRRWLRAARQDLDAGIGFLHASYGIGTLDILRQVASDAEIKAATGADPLALQNALTEIQDKAQRRLTRRGEEAMYSHPNQWEGNSELGELGTWWGQGAWSGWGWWPWNWGMKPVQQRTPMHRSQWYQLRRMGYSDTDLYDFLRDL